MVRDRSNRSRVKRIPPNKQTYNNKTHSNKTIMTKSTIRFWQISDYNLVNGISEKERPANNTCAWRQTWPRKRRWKYENLPCLSIKYYYASGGRSLCVHPLSARYPHSCPHNKDAVRNRGTQAAKRARQNLSTIWVILKKKPSWTKINIYNFRSFYTVYVLIKLRLNAISQPNAMNNILNSLITYIVLYYILYSFI